jgi:hypothetical protein
MKNFLGPLLVLILALSSANLGASPLAAAAAVNLALAPAVQSVNVGDIFEVVVQSRSGDQAVVGVDAYLDFDFTKLAVVDMNSAAVGIQISDGATLTTPLWNLANNETGRIAYSCGSFSPYPSGTFTIATIRFMALAPTATTTAVTFSTSPERPTTVVGDNRATVVTGALSGGEYTLIPQIAPDPPSVGGGSGGGGNPNRIETPGLTADMALYMSVNGVTQNTTRLMTPDGKAALNIGRGTTILNDAGNPLSVLSAEAMRDPPAVPAVNALVSAYNFGPSGATFNPPIVLFLAYDPISLPKGVYEADLFVAYFDGTAWLKLDSTVDLAARTVNAMVSHFSSFGLLGRISLPAVLSPIPEPAFTPEPVVIPALPPAVTIEPTASSRSPEVTLTIPLLSTVPIVRPSPPVSTQAAAAKSTPRGVILAIVAGAVVIAVSGLILARRRSARNRPH